MPSKTCIEDGCKKEKYGHHSRCHDHRRKYVNIANARARERRDNITPEYDVVEHEESWYSRHPPMDEEVQRQLNAAQYEIDKRIRDKLADQRDMGRILSREEIEMIQAQITPVSQIKEYPNLYWKDL